MRHWLFHPLVFYPLAALFAAFVVAVSVRPQAWPRPPAQVSATASAGTLTLEGGQFSTPAPAPEQNLAVVRDFWGQAQALRIARRPNQPPPSPAEQGVRLLLSPVNAAAIEGKRVIVEVSYNPIAINTASGLAVSLRGASPSVWVSQPAPPQSGTLEFRLPAQTGVSAIGLRALSEENDQAYGIEITRIRIRPHP